MSSLIDIGGRTVEEYDEYAGDAIGARQQRRFVAAAMPAMEYCDHCRFRELADQDGSMRCVVLRCEVWPSFWCGHWEERTGDGR